MDVDTQLRRLLKIDPKTAAMATLDELVDEFHAKNPHLTREQVFAHLVTHDKEARRLHGSHLLELKQMVKIEAPWQPTDGRAFRVRKITYRERTPDMGMSDAEFRKHRAAMVDHFAKKTGSKAVTVDPDIKAAVESAVAKAMAPKVDEATKRALLENARRVDEEIRITKFGAAMKGDIDELVKQDTFGPLTSVWNPRGAAADAAILKAGSTYIRLDREYVAKTGHASHETPQLSPHDLQTALNSGGTFVNPMATKPARVPMVGKPSSAPTSTGRHRQDEYEQEDEGEEDLGETIEKIARAMMARDSNLRASTAYEKASYQAFRARREKLEDA